MTMQHFKKNLPTPSLIVESKVLQKNLDRVQAIAQQAGVELRPHCKTAKSPEIARLATEGFSGAITVATLNEAEYFARHGFNDITLAVNIIPSKLERVKALQLSGVTITVLTDTLEVAQAIALGAKAFPSRLPVLIEIDTGTNRTGLLPDSPKLIPLATCINESSHLDFRGLLSFGGMGYRAHTREEAADYAELERTHILEAKGHLLNADIECPVVSVGSTPNVLSAHSFKGITEIRPGVYVFGDLMMKSIGIYDYADIAVTVLASVIGHNRSQNRIYIDAGALALSQDQGYDRNGLPYAPYGLIRQKDSPLPYEGIGVCQVNQEHGFVECLNPDAPFPFDAFPIGSTLRVIPNHACHSIEGFKCYHVVDDNGQVMAEWERTNGW